MKKLVFWNSSKKAPKTRFLPLRPVSLFLCALLLIASLLPIVASAETTEDKVVRVGWYESPFCQTTEEGVRSGYAYEYQEKIAAYTGWTYEYVVRESWAQLLEMLRAGELDLLSDVSYTEERAEDLLYPSTAMGTEEYYVFVSPDNAEVIVEDRTTLTGKRVAVTKGSIQSIFLKSWLEANELTVDLVEITTSENDAIDDMNRGVYDAYVTLDFYGDPNKVAPLWKIGSSDFYFAINKERPDLLNDLDLAMSKIQSENRYYNLQLFEKYFRSSASSFYLGTDEQAWVKKHGTIRVGYQDNYLAFCAQDKNGELTGALKDYLDYAASNMKNAQVTFEAVSFPSVGEAIAAMKEGRVDCVFPANFTDYESETLEIYETPSLMRTEMYAVVREKDQNSFFEKKNIRVAVNEGNTNYVMFLHDHFPDWEPVYFADTPAGLKAIADGDADCLLISNYRFSNISKLCEKYHLTTLSTGVDMDYCFAVNRGQQELYSILTKTTTVVPTSLINAALSHYMAEDAKLSFWDFIRENIPVIVTAFLVVAAVILALAWNNARNARQALAKQKLIAATEADELTGLYNRNFFFAYVDRMYQEEPDKHRDAIAVDIDQFRSVNALNGRDFGDKVLKTLGEEIRALLSENDGIAGRLEADRFDIFCSCDGNYKALFDRLQGKLDDLSSNASIRLCMGVAPWQEGVDPTTLFDRAHAVCNQATGRRQNRLAFFDKAAYDRESKEQRLMGDLRRAVQNREFEVYYQPKYDISCNPPQPSGAEALVRWNHPELGLIAPGEFIPLFERTGQIEELDEYVWAQTAKQVALWKEKYGVLVPVSVNLSRIDIFDAELEQKLNRVLSDSGLDRDALKLEVTESAYTENADEFIRILQDLRKKGYRFEMDDFGAGYSSLGMLAEMPVDLIKMDRSFIHSLDKDEKNLQMVKLVLDIAKNLKLPVVAEGVETEAQLNLLKQLGCTLVQGYYFSKPIPAAEFEKTILQQG